MESVSHRENYMGKFCDKRLDKRASQLSRALYFGRSSSIHEVTSSEAEQRGAYRFLGNEMVKESILIDTVKEKSGYLCAGKDLIVLQDTTEINLDNHHNRLKPNTGIGLTGNNKDLGFFLHASLVLDAATEACLGFSDIQLWHRQQDKAAVNYTKLPIEEKESYKWLKAAGQSKLHLCEACSITVIEDREGDIYEQFATIPDERTHLIIRSRDDRCLLEGGKLYQHLAAQPLAGSYQIAIVKDIRKGVESRIATVEVRFCQAGIAKPRKVKNKEIAGETVLSAVEVREIGGPLQHSILWRLLTTHPVSTYEEALHVVRLYRLRWYIEQLFRLLKSRGFQIELSELESGWAIRKLTVMLLSTAIRVMQLLLAYKEPDSQPIGQVFDQGEISCLQRLNETLQGTTEKNRNGNDPSKLAWATWIIARLGGWKNQNAKRPPGPILLKKGVDKFNGIYQGYQLALKT